MKDEFRLSRRGFGSWLATGTTAMVFSATTAEHLPANEPVRTVAGPVPAPPALPEDQPTTPEIPEATWLLGAILKHYPDERLDQAAVTGILGDIHGDLARSRVLSGFPLENADEPGFVFRAWSDTEPV